MKKYFRILSLKKTINKNHALKKNYFKKKKVYMIKSSLFKENSRTYFSNVLFIGRFHLHQISLRTTNVATNCLRKIMFILEINSLIQQTFLIRFSLSLLFLTPSSTMMHVSPVGNVI